MEHSEPKHLGEKALEAWKEITSGLTPAERLGIDRPALEAYAVLVARIRDARSRIDREGLIVADEKGRPIAHPALEIEKSLAAELRRWLDRYRPRVQMFPAGALENVK